LTLSKKRSTRKKERPNIKMNAELLCTINRVPVLCAVAEPEPERESEILTGKMLLGQILHSTFG
jgi:hypothetical protein